MAAAREAVKRAWDGWDLVGSDPTLDAAIEIEQPRWSSEKDHNMDTTTAELGLSAPKGFGAPHTWSRDQLKTISAMVQQHRQEKA